MTREELVAAKIAFEAKVAEYRRGVSERHAAEMRALEATLDIDWRTLPSMTVVASMKHEVSGRWIVRVLDIDPRFATGDETKALFLGVDDLTEEVRPEFMARYMKIYETAQDEAAFQRRTHNVRWDDR